jgi:hypothetical protein
MNFISNLSYKKNMHVYTHAQIDLVSAYSISRSTLTDKITIRYTILNWLYREQTIVFNHNYQFSVP